MRRRTRNEEGESDDEINPNEHSESKQLEDQLRQDPSLTLDEATSNITTDTVDAVVIPKVDLLKNGGDNKKLKQIQRYLNGSGNTVITRDALILLPEGGKNNKYVFDIFQKSAKSSDAENSDTEVTYSCSHLHAYFDRN